MAQSVAMTLNVRARGRDLGPVLRDDVLPVVVLLAASLAEQARLRPAFFGPHGRSAFLVALLAGTVPLLARRILPLPVLLIVSAVPAIAAFREVALSNGTIIALLIGVYSYAAYGDRFAPWTAPIIGGLGIAKPLMVLDAPYSVLLVISVELVAAAYAGAARRRAATAVRVLDNRAALVQTERSLLLRMVVADERMRLAADLRAIVSRVVAQMRDLAQGAARLAPTAARARLDQLIEAGNAGLGEMRVVLQALRGSSTNLAAPGSLQQLADFATAHRFSFTTSPADLVLPEPVDHAVTRLVVDVLDAAGSDSHLEVAVISDGDMVRVNMEVAADGETLRNAVAGAGERLRLIAGTVSVTTGTRTTRLVARIPVSRTARREEADGHSAVSETPPAWWRRDVRGFQFAFDVVAFLVLAIIGGWVTVHHKEFTYDARYGAPAVAMTVAVAATVLFRRRLPWAALLLAAALTLLDAALRLRLSDLRALALGLDVVAVASRTTPAGALLAAVVATAGESVFLWRLAWIQGAVEATLLLAGGIYVLAAAAGQALQQADRRASQVRDQLAQIQAQRELQADIAVRNERADVARELHDVVAHAISTMVVQAGGARALLERDPPRASEALDVVLRTADDADRELAELVGVLADAPQSDVEQLDIEHLLDEARRGGMVVDYVVHGAIEVPTSLRLTTYRVVQEALTNSRKHAPGARVTVALTRDNGSITVDISDDGCAGVDVPVQFADSGFGLAGMSERVALLGGDLSAGPIEHGGFRVRARLPVHA